ncbi:MAG: RHS repeat protein [Chloroflexi bacterium]|nr:RHS repeat protein [Chloroflexota bacterium]
MTDALGRQTNSEYDQLHRLAKVTDALANPTTYTYDATGNRLTTTNALGKTWTTTYDRPGRVQTAAGPLGNTTTNTYDAAGVLTQVVKPNGATITNTYDRVYRRTGLSATMTPSSGNVSVTWAYDAAGRRTSMTDATGTTTCTYDNANRLTTLTYPVTGHQVTYQYNSRGLLRKVTDWQSKVTSTRRRCISRRLGGRQLIWRSRFRLVFLLTIWNASMTIREKRNVVKHIVDLHQPRKI